jgi:hypothetical protein
MGQQLSRCVGGSGVCPAGGLPTLVPKEEQAQAVTAEAFEEDQRALAEAEMAVADLRAELERAEQTRDQNKRDSDRAHAADAQAAVEAERAGRRVANLLTRIETL